MAASPQAGGVGVGEGSYTWLVVPDKLVAIRLKQARRAAWWGGGAANMYALVRSSLDVERQRGWNGLSSGFLCLAPSSAPSPSYFDERGAAA
eukprot:2786199-Prymnesium_polylepis.1